MLGVSIAVGVINIAETSAELALSPWTYVDDLMFTHDLSRDAPKPDPATTPSRRRPTSYTVTAMFDDGTPHVQTFTLPTPVPSTLPPVVFPQRAARRSGQRLGGVRAGGAPCRPGRRAARQGHDRAGRQRRQRRRADLVDRGAEVPDRRRTPSTAQAEDERSTRTATTSGRPPPGADRQRRQHRLRRGRHHLCGFNGITVRQGTSQRGARGYVGYSWRGQTRPTASERRRLRSGGGTGQLDTVANLGTRRRRRATPSRPAALQPRRAASPTTCSAHGSANYYLDTTDPPRRRCAR